MADRPRGRTGTVTRRDRPRGTPRADPGDALARRPAGRYLRTFRPLLRGALLLLTALPALALALPIALVNWCIFRRPGRILFSQPRVGRHGRVFRILKFRTMVGDDDEFDSWKSGRDDLRVTRFGRFLRNTHLDELPQLLNILRGEMDFVGPRPEMVPIHEWACERVPRFAERGALLPGVTGLAQVTLGYTGKDEVAYARKLALDLEYLQRVSLRLDLAVLARTILWMVRGRGWQTAAGERGTLRPVPAATRERP